MITSERKKALYATVFNRVAPSFDRVGPQHFTKFGRRLVEQADIPAGAKVLDVAAGRGAILFPTAERVGPQGQVIGIDFAEAMVTQTAAEISRLKLPNAEMRWMDAERLEFPNASFDFALCGFAFAFFPQPERACAEMYRALKPGGRLLASLEGGVEGQGCWFQELLRKHLLPQSGQPESKPSPSAASQPPRPAALMERVGFVEVQVEVDDGELLFADEEEWWAWTWSNGSSTGLGQMRPEQLAAFKSEAFARLQADEQADGFHYPFPVEFTCGTKPLDRKRPKMP